MQTCYCCNESIGEPGDSFRYCPNCGAALMIVCCRPHCEGWLVVREDTSCQECGSLYRYSSEICRPGTHEPDICSPLGPFHVSRDSGAVDLVDLFPASGDSCSYTAVLASAANNQGMDPPPRLHASAGMCRPEARHGRLYYVPASGEISALDLATGKRVPNWHGSMVSSVPEDLVHEASLHVSETFVYGIFGGQVNVFGAADGRAFASIPLDGLVEPQALIVRDRLLVTGTGNQGFSFRLFHLDGQNALHELDSGGLRETLSPGLPATRIKWAGDVFYMLTNGGSLLSVPPSGGTPTRHYANEEGRSIRAWETTDQTVMLLLDPSAHAGAMLVGIPHGSPASDPLPIQERPHPHLHDLPMIGDDVFLLNEKGYLVRLSATSSYGQPAVRSWPVLVGFPSDAIQAIPGVSLVPGMPYVAVIHYADAMAHMFACITVAAAPGTGAGTPPRPARQHEICGVFCGVYYYVCNLTTGNITPVRLLGRGS